MPVEYDLFIRKKKKNMDVSIFPIIEDCDNYMKK